MPAIKSYVSIDIETLGLDHRTCDIIEFGAVIDDLQSPIDQLPTFHRYILPPSRYGYEEKTNFYQGEPFAMAMHAEKLQRIATQASPYSYCEPSVLVLHFLNFLNDNGYENPLSASNMYESPSAKQASINVAGKNFSAFDQKFISHMKDFDKLVKIHHRIIDPAMLYFDIKTDDKPPSLDLCLQRAGIDKNVTHNAVDDAKDVIKCLRFKWDLPI